MWSWGPTKSHASGETGKLCIESHSGVSILMTEGMAAVIGHSELLITWPSLECFLASCMNWLEVNKCAFTFSSEIRQIQCMCTEFWCVQCPRPAGPSALDKHQIQASALDLSCFTSKSKCKFINLIHTRQKNKIICSCSWRIINKMALKCH